MDRLIGTFPHCIWKSILRYIPGLGDRLALMSTCPHIRHLVMTSTYTLTNSVPMIIPLKLVQMFSGIKVIDTPVYVRISNCTDLEHLVRYSSEERNNHKTLCVVTTRKVTSDILEQLSRGYQWLGGDESGISPYSASDTHIRHELCILFANDSDIGYGMVRFSPTHLVITDASIIDGADISNIIGRNHSVSTILCPGSIPLPKSRPMFLNKTKEPERAVLISCPHKMKESYVITLENSDWEGSNSFFGMRVGVSNPFIIQYAMIMSMRAPAIYIPIGTLFSLVMLNLGLERDDPLISESNLEAICRELLAGQIASEIVSMMVSGYIGVLEEDIIDIVNSPLLEDIGEWDSPISHPLSSADMAMYQEMEPPFNRRELRDSMKHMIVTPTTSISNLLEHAEVMSDLYRSISRSNGIVTGSAPKMTKDLGDFYLYGTMVDEISHCGEMNITVGDYIDLFGC